METAPTIFLKDIEQFISDSIDLNGGDDGILHSRWRHLPVPGSPISSIPLYRPVYRLFLGISHVNT
jgi:hypothetical protein